MKQKSIQNIADRNIGAISIDRRMMVAGTLVGVAMPTMAFGKRDDSLDSFLNEQLGSGRIPGMAIGVARHGRTIIERAYGFADLTSRRRVTVDTIFHLASITKTVTATAVMMLAEAGKIDLDVPANHYLDFEVFNPHHPAVTITVRHLLMHMSSISDETYYQVDFRTAGSDSPLSLGKMLKDYLLPGGENYPESGSFSSSPPGQVYDYCNIGYGLLGYLAGNVAGEDLRSFTQRRLFAPLAMKHLSWTIAGVPANLGAIPYDVVENQFVPVKPVGFPDWSAGMLRASIASFMPFVAASANGGATDRNRILLESSEAEMLNMHVPPQLPDWLTGQGLGWAQSQLGAKRYANHWGGDPGVFTAVYLDPESTTGIAIFTNSSATSASRIAIKEIAQYLFSAVL